MSLAAIFIFDAIEKASKMAINKKRRKAKHPFVEKTFNSNVTKFEKH